MPLVTTAALRSPQGWHRKQLFSAVHRANCSKNSRALKAARACDALAFTIEAMASCCASTGNLSPNFSRTITAASGVSSDARMRCATCATSASERRNAKALLAMSERFASRSTLARSSRRCTSVKRFTLERRDTASLPHSGEASIRLISSSNWDALRTSDLRATVDSASGLSARSMISAKTRSRSTLRELLERGVAPRSEDASHRLPPAP